VQVVNVKAGSDYPVYIGSGLLPQLGSLYRRHGLHGRALLVSDETVFKRYGQTALDSLKASEVEAQTAVVPPGEGSKSLTLVDDLYECLIRHRFHRTAVVVALGGGVVGDLTGFVAATYLRGVTLVQVPTTLLAQVDSSVGGKTGVNHVLGKNLIGAFYTPSFVLADLDVLTSLPPREWYSGMAEVIKYGLIADRKLFDGVERFLTPQRPGAELEALVTRCVQIKAEVVAKDEREAGLRKSLNFGHTLGHALESLTAYHHFRHGEAVLWGMLGEAYLSYRYGALSEMEFLRIYRLLGQVKRPALPALKPDTFLEHVRRDKKNQDGHIHAVWLRHIGSCYVEPVSEDQLLNVLGFWSREAQQPLARR